MREMRHILVAANVLNDYVQGLLVQKARFFEDYIETKVMQVYVDESKRLIIKT